MTRLVRDWVVPVALSVAVGTGLFWLGMALGVPSIWLFHGPVVLAAAASIALWVDSGGTVVSILTWLAPTLAIWATVFVWPTRPGIVVLGALAVLPIAAATIAPIGRWFDRLVRRTTFVLTRFTLARRDRETLRRLTEAQRAGAPNRELEPSAAGDPARFAAAIHGKEQAIRAVPAPDPGWEEAIRRWADVMKLWRAVYLGTQPGDVDTVSDAMAGAQAGVHELLRNRSRAYRVLTHRFRPLREEPSSRDVDRA